MVNYIGFACTTIFHYLHFKRISSHFDERAIFITATPHYTNNRYEKLVGYFEDHGIPYCTTADLISRRILLKAVVAPYFLPVFNFIDKDILRIRMLYGYAKDAWNYAEWNKNFDLILAYGPYSERKLEGFAPTISVGHPRFIGISQGLQENVLSIDGDSLSYWLEKEPKETLLFCPTWGDLSSFEWFKAAINQLLTKYKVIIKLHHGIALSGQYSFDHSAFPGLFVCDETVDLFSLFPVSDLVISDYSGAIFDAMLAKKKIILANSISESILDTGVLNIRKMSNIGDLQVQEPNQEMSLDVQMRSVFANTSNPSELIDIVEKVLDEDIVDYSDLNLDLYSYQDDLAALRAYHAIKKLESQENNLPRKSVEESIAFDKNTFQHFINANKECSFIVWGAGDIGQLIVSWLHQNDYTITGILDKDPNKIGKILHNIPIKSPESYERMQHEKVIFSFPIQNIDSLLSQMPNMTLSSGQYNVPFK
ncbi:CDP-glycerol glycerophosphotransferase family protein [Cohnella sp.]|uniref:CDP-glycerol glycerophosphotransferase family protein n=1 Tax=Cohnella sp. TaxID=1883426 RepID=UPI0035649B9B